MNRTYKVILGGLCVICWLISLWGVNRDLYSFRYDRLCRRKFTPETDLKGTYRLAELPALKTGRYEISFDGGADFSGSYFILVTADDTIYDSFKISGGSVDPSFRVSVETNPGKLHAGIQYDPISGEVSFSMIRLSSDHVLFREALLRHFVLSTAVCLVFGLFALYIFRREAFFRVFPWVRESGNVYVFVTMTALTVLTSLPLLNPRTYSVSEDMFFHLTRIEGLAESLKAGYFPVKDQLYWLQNYGYGCGFFYPDLFLYIPAIFRILGFSLLGVYKGFLVGCTFSALLTTYLAVYGITKRRTAGITAIIFQAFSAYRLINIYYRGTLGETQALVFLPLIVWGLYEIFHEHPEHWGLFAFGFWGLLSCHLITLGMAGAVTAVYFVFRIRTIFCDRKILGALVRSVLCVFLAGISFIGPMLEQILAVPDLRLNLNVISNNGLMNSNLVMPFRNLFILFHNWDNMYQWQSVYPGIAFLFIPLFGILTVRKKRTPELRCADRLLIIGAFLLVMGTDVFPWQYFSAFATKIQFAWRFMVIVSALFPICAGIYWLSLPGTGKSVLPQVLLAVICFFLSGYMILKETAVNRTISKDLFVMQDNRVSGAEYLPYELTAEFADKNRDTVLCDDSTFIVTSHDRKRLSFSFTYEILSEDNIEIRVPLVYYKGFRGEITLPDGSIRNLPVDEADNGLVRVYTSGIPSGSICVHYEKTTIELICELVSAGFLAGSLIQTVIYLRKKKCLKKRH